MPIRIDTADGKTYTLPGRLTLGGAKDKVAASSWIETDAGFVQTSQIVRVYEAATPKKARARLSRPSGQQPRPGRLSDSR
jgi:hypothetical protein